MLSPPCVTQETHVKGQALKQHIYRSPKVGFNQLHLVVQQPELRVSPNFSAYLVHINNHTKTTKPL